MSLALLLATACGDDDDGETDAGVDSGVDSSSPQDNLVTTLAGSNEAGTMDGQGSSARFSNPVNVTVAPSGEIFVADFDNGSVRRVSPDGTVSTVPVSGMGFARPFGLAVAPDGTLYVQTDMNTAGERGAGALWYLRPQRSSLELLFDNIGRTRGIAVLPDNTLMLSDEGRHVLWMFDPATTQRTLLAGMQGVAGNQVGTGTEARFNQPYDIVPFTETSVLVADRGNNVIRLVTLDGVVTTWAGTGEATATEGARLDASFHAPQALAINDGVVYVTSTGGYVIQAVEADTVTLIAGSGEPGFQDGNASEAEFFGLEGIDVSPDGMYLYIADGNRGENQPYHRLRRLELD